MKISIDIVPLTHQYLEDLVARGEYETIEDAVEHCFLSHLSTIYEADLAAGRVSD